MMANPGCLAMGSLYFGVRKPPGKSKGCLCFGIASSVQHGESETIREHVSRSWKRNLMPGDLCFALDISAGDCYMRDQFSMSRPSHNSNYVQLSQSTDDLIEKEDAATAALAAEKHAADTAPTTNNLRLTAVLALILFINILLAGGAAMASRQLSTSIQELRRADDVSTLPRPDALVGLKGHPIPEWSCG